MKAPELDAGLQVRSHQSGVDGQNPLPHPAGHAAFDAAEDTSGFLVRECTLTADVEFLIKQHSQVLLLRAAFNPFSARPIFVLGIALTRVQDLILSLGNCWK